MPAQTIGNDVFIPLAKSVEAVKIKDGHMSMITPLKNNGHYQLETPDTVFSPESTNSFSGSSVYSESSDDDNAAQFVISPKITITEHKRLELEGKFASEPLLRENPGRFVLFPVQYPQVSNNDDVSHKPTTTKF